MGDVGSAAEVDQRAAAVDRRGRAVSNLGVDQLNLVLVMLCRGWCMLALGVLSGMMWYIGDVGEKPVTLNISKRSSFLTSRRWKGCFSLTMFLANVSKLS